MLLGRTGIKADTMIRRFVSRALSIESIDPRRAALAMEQAAEQLGTEPHLLDHAVWSFQRNSVRAGAR